MFHNILVNNFRALFPLCAKTIFFGGLYLFLEKLDRTSLKLMLHLGAILCVLLKRSVEMGSQGSHHLFDHKKVTSLK